MKVQSHGRWQDSGRGTERALTRVCSNRIWETEQINIGENRLKGNQNTCIFLGYHFDLRLRYIQLVEFETLVGLVVFFWREMQFSQNDCGCNKRPAMGPAQRQVPKLYQKLICHPSPVSQNRRHASNSSSLAQAPPHLCPAKDYHRIGQNYDGDGQDEKILRSHYMFQMGTDFARDPNSKISRESVRLSRHYDQARRSSKASFNYIEKKYLHSEEDEIVQQTENEDLEFQFKGKSIQEMNSFLDYLSYGSQESMPEDFKEVQETLKWKEFMKLRKMNYLENYNVGAPLGKGSFGEVSKVVHKYTKIAFAAKKISKDSIQQHSKKEVFTEMSILNQLDHPYIIKLIEVYDHMRRYVLILEFMEGAKSLEKYARQHGNSLHELQLIGIMRQLFLALNYLSCNNIIHRDIKCDNVIIEPSENTIKLIDFGTATFFFQKSIKALVGTPAYTALEVFDRSYGNEIDVWSCGVMLYRLISGSLPFEGSADGMGEIVKKTPLKFSGSIWKKVSPQCKNLIEAMLQKNRFKRIKIKQCLSHEWLGLGADRNYIYEEIVMRRICNFKFLNSIQCLVHTYIVSHLLKAAEKNEMTRVFEAFDKNNDGVITKNELEGIFCKFYDDYKDRAARAISLIDLNKSGSINYTEFLVAAIKPREYINRSNLENAFHFFDMDHNGYITIDEMTIFLEEKVENREQIKQIFDRADRNNDGLISKDQFVGLLQSIMNYSQVNREKTKAFSDLEQQKILRTTSLENLFISKEFQLINHKRKQKQRQK